MRISVCAHGGSAVNPASSFATACIVFKSLLYAAERSKLRSRNLGKIAEEVCARMIDDCPDLGVSHSCQLASCGYHSHFKVSVDCKGDMRRCSTRY